MSYYAAIAPEKIDLAFLPLNSISTPPKGVDIWLLDLSKINAEDSAIFSSVISEHERERAQQFKKNQHHFLATRALQRQALSHYTEISPEQLLIARTDSGKPFLTNSPFALHFNLSHSGNFAALAVSTQGEIGVDIETARKRSYLQIVERFFHADEIKQFHDCNKEDEEQLFYRLWTLKEAFFKAIGTGISTGLDKAYFHLQDNQIDAHFADALNVKKSEWQFHQEFIAPTTIVATALQSAEPINIQWINGNSLLATTFT